MIYRLYQAKYKTDPLTAGIKNKIPIGASYAFRSMSKATIKVKEHSKHHIGDRSSTSITQDWWVGRGKVFNQIQPNSSLSQLSKVQDLISNGKWNAPMIWKNFKRETTRDILAINLPSPQNEDSFSWSLNSNGINTAKSGYWALIKEVSPQHPKTESISFSYHVWHLNILPKWQIFMWKLTNKAIPTAENLAKRKILVPIECHFCGTQYETMEHLFRDCQFSIKIWMTTMGIRPSTQPMIPLDKWIKNFMKVLKDRDSHEEPHNNDSRATTFISTLWAIWLHRNEIVFRGSNPSPDRIMQIFQESMSRLQVFQSTNILEKTKSTGNKNISWTKGRIKDKEISCVQVDGAWKQQKSKNSWEAAIAWIEEGNHSNFEAYKVLASSAIQTEARALYECIQHWSQKTRAISIKTDCRELVKKLRSEEGTFIDIKNLVFKIKNLAITSILFLVPM